MTLHLTPAMAEGAYTLLRTTPPFRRLKLPEGDTIEFHIYHRKHRWHAECMQLSSGQFRISINNFKCGTLHKLLMDVAHEATHLHLYIAHPKDTASHGWRFNRIADSICKFHVWDRTQF